jgi:hypothetical protein
VLCHHVRGFHVYLLFHNSAWRQAYISLLHLISGNARRSVAGAIQEGARGFDPFSDAAPSPAEETQDPKPHQEVRRYCQLLLALDALVLSPPAGMETVQLSHMQSLFDHGRFVT